MVSHFLKKVSSRDEKNRQESIPVDAYCPLVVIMCFNSQKMSALVGIPEVNKLERVSSVDHHVTSRVIPVQRVPMCSVRSNAAWVIVTWDPIGVQTDTH